MKTQQDLAREERATKAVDFAIRELIAINATLEDVIQRLVSMQMNDRV